MMFRSLRVLTAILVFAGVALGANSAFAAIGIPITLANLRAGPGIGFAIVGSVFKGEKLRVIKCQGEWCFIIHPGTDGWVSRKLIYNPLYNRGRGFEYPKRAPGPDRIAPGR